MKFVAMIVLMGISAYSATLPRGEIITLLLTSVLAAIQVGLPATFTLAAALCAKTLAKLGVLLCDQAFHRIILPLLKKLFPLSLEVCAGLPIEKNIFNVLLFCVPYAGLVRFKVLPDRVSVTKYCR